MYRARRLNETDSANRRRTIETSEGRVHTLDDFPIKIEREAPIDLNNALNIEAMLSQELGIAVMLYGCLAYPSQDSLNNYYQYSLYSPRSVMLYFATEKYGSTNVLDFVSFNEPEMMIGLWDGENVRDVAEMLLEWSQRTGHNFNSLSYCSIIGLSNHSFNFSQNNKNKNQQTKLKYIRHFIDSSGRGLILPYNIIPHRLYDDSHWALTHTEDDTLALFHEITSPSYWISCENPAELMGKVSLFQDLSDLSRVNIKTHLSLVPKSQPEMICGHPIYLVRKVLRSIATGAVSNNYCCGIGLTIAQLRGLLFDLLTQGYLKPKVQDEPKHFPQNMILTKKGMCCASKSYTKKMKRTDIEGLLFTAINRCIEVNELPCFILNVESIYVFGSYLNRNQESFYQLDLVLVLDDKNKFIGSEELDLSGDNLKAIQYGFDDSYRRAYSNICKRRDYLMELKERDEISYTPLRMSKYHWLTYDNFSILHRLCCGNRMN